MATPDTHNSRANPAGIRAEDAEANQSPVSEAVPEDEFATHSRFSALFVLGACVGLAVAIGGFVAEASWVVVTGSCVTLAMALAWVAAGMPPLVRTIRSWSHERRLARVRRDAAE